MYYFPWWVLLACLAASALAVYLILERTQAGDSSWALFSLTAALAPVVLMGAVVAAITLSTLLSVFLEEWTGPPTDSSELPAESERTGPSVMPPSSSTQQYSPEGARTSR